MRNADQNTRLDIDLQAIKQNYKIIENKITKKCSMAVTVKANAYGLGVKKIAPELIKLGCENFFVATTNEGIELRTVSKKINIFILNGLVVKDIKVIARHNLVPVINNLSQLARIEKYQARNKKKLNIALHFDTGMSRLGLDKIETNFFLRNKSKLLKMSNLILVMSHLACADNKKSKMNKVQLKKFINLKKSFPNTPFSLSNSAGIQLGKKYHFDMVRPGISIYGGDCLVNGKNPFKNVVSLSAKIIQIREIEKNDTIGYGATYKAKSKMKIGTLAFGYADGFNRHFSNNFHLYIDDNKLNIVGRVSMDLITVDLSRFQNFENLANKEVKIISEKFSINKISKLINTIPYEILTNLGKRYQRRYIL